MNNSSRGKLNSIHSVPVHAPTVSDVNQMYAGGGQELKLGCIYSLDWTIDSPLTPKIVQIWLNLALRLFHYSADGLVMLANPSHFTTI